MKHFSMLRRSGDRGFALIEALIAVVVLATGLLALTALQGALVRSSADSKARSQVAAYVAGEMDRIRTGGAVSAKSATTAGTDDISLSARAAGLSTLNQTASGATYFADASGNFATTNPNTGKNAWFRRVTLNMGWTDAAGGGRALSMTTDISPLALNSSKVLVDRAPSDDTGLRPIVRRPSPVTEGMIPIATGGVGDEATAATNPKPKLLGGDSGTYVSDTRFDILTYSGGADVPANFVRFNKNIETAVVGCTCRNNTDGFTGGGPGSYLRAFLLAKGYRPTYWDGRAYKTPDAAGAVSSSPAAGSQSTLCDVCCRDHKDPGAESGPKFSPWPGQDPLHYKFNSGGALVLASGPADEYLEACRVIRVDGIFRVAADPKIQDNALVPTREYPSLPTSGSLLAGVSNNDSATFSLLAVAGKPLYENYAYDAVSSLFFSTSGIADVGNSTNFATIQQSTNLNRPTYVPIKPTSDKRWLHSRVFMTDFLESDARTRLQEASTDCADSSSARLKAQCVLPFVPLASINTTEIASWSPRAATAAEVAAAPSPLNTLPPNYLDYASANILRFNSGLALFSKINDSEASLPAIDEQLFVQLAASAPTRAVWLNTPSPNPSTAKLFGDVLNPMRGYALTAADILFKLQWNFKNGPIKSPVSGGFAEPTATVTGSSKCTSRNSVGSLINPYTPCFSPSSTSVEISIAGYNRIEKQTADNTCTPSVGDTFEQDVCMVYTFGGASVNTPAGGYTLVSTTGNGKNQVITFSVPAISPTTASTVTVDFPAQPTRTPVLFTCLGTVPTYTIPCE